MPAISAFFGITVRMYYQDHEPAHFHAEYQGARASFLLDGTLLAGDLRSRRARALVQEWALEHRAELQANWARMKQGEPLVRIEPLE